MELRPRRAIPVGPGPGPVVLTKLSINVVWFAPPACGNEKVECAVTYNTSGDVGKGSVGEKTGGGERKISVCGDRELSDVAALLAIALQPGVNFVGEILRDSGTPLIPVGALFSTTLIAKGIVTIVERQSIGGLVGERSVDARHIKSCRRIPARSWEEREPKNWKIR